jgi:hypothetical protein
MQWWCVVSAMTMLSLTAVPAISADGQASAGVTAAGPSSAQIQGWVGQLNSERFLDREVATEKLIAAGGDAVGPVLAATAENTLEVTTRAVYILQELALSGNAAVSDAAQAALEKVAEPRLTSAARRARATLVRLDLIRQERAVQELRRLGASIAEGQLDFRLGLAEGYTVELGEGWQGQLQDLSRLRWLRDANEVILQGPQVTDDWLKYVAAMSELRMLTVKRASVSDEGLKHITVLKGLSVLSLMYVPVSDQTVAVLRQFQSVDKFRIYGGQLTAAGVEELRRVLPTCDIDFRRGAFLGVGCQDGTEGCLVLTVRPRSAAEKAGLLLNDVILEYRGQKVLDYKTLTALIAGNVAGDTVTVKIARDGRTLSKRVTLGEWE